MPNPSNIPGLPGMPAVTSDKNDAHRSSHSASVPIISTILEDDGCDESTHALLARRSKVSVTPQSMSVPVSLRPSPSPSVVEALSTHSVCLVEVAPVDSCFCDSESGSAWKPSLSEFSNRKTSLQGETSKHLKKRIRKYYRAQDKLIEEFEALEEKGLSDGDDLLEQANSHRLAQRLSQVSFAANFVLLVVKAVAVGLSGSISIIGSLVDSAVDLLSGVVIWYTSRAMQRSNPYIYPSGKRRLEPLAIVVLSVIMSLASFQLIIESIQKIIAFTSEKSGVPRFEVPTIVITASTIVVKLGLFLMCYFVGRKHDLLSTSVGILMQDHRNDVLSNAVALICGYLGSQQFAAKTGQENIVFIDPIGAVLIGAYILVSWWKTGLEQIRMLTGVSAKPEFLSKLTWICLNHHPCITQIDTVRAFHFGSRFLVEVDIVLPKDMTLDTTHGIGESLQQKLEGLKEVERAFVHVDWESEHRPEVEHKVG
ncbi:uncharacterized protein LOC143301979 [Babylonia areolata]|uniref:uncharacterized protein LOC143301979 n=1 Tax=Babylonia areolata TaxID=304850 RepID=UPI003FD3867E